MGVNKNFVVKNGLEVADGLLFTDADNNVVGVGSTVPDSNYIFHVTGGIGATTLNVSSQATSNTITATTSVTVGTAVTVSPGGFNAPAGVVTASSFVGALTGDVTGTASTAQSLTGSPSIIVGISTISGVVFNSGIVTSSNVGASATYYGKFIGDVSEATGLTASPGGNDTEIQYNDQESTTQGAAYFVYNKTTNSVGIGTSVATNTLTVVGSGTSTTDLRVTGVSTFEGSIVANGQIDIDGHTELDDANVSGIITAASASVTNLSGTIGTITNIEGTSLNYTGFGTVTNIEGTSLNYTGFGTVGVITATTSIVVGSAVTINDTGINVLGIVTATTLSGTDINYTGFGTVGILSATTSGVIGPVGSAITFNSDGFVTANSGVGTVGILSATTSGVIGPVGSAITFNSDGFVTANSGVGTVGILTALTSLTVGSAATVNSDGLIVSGLSTFTSGSGSVTAGSATTSVLIVNGDTKVSGSVSFSHGGVINNHIQFEAAAGQDRTLAMVGFSTQYDRYRINWTPGYSGSAAYGMKFVTQVNINAGTGFPPFYVSDTWAQILRSGTTLQAPLTLNYSTYGGGVNALTVNNSSGADALVVTSNGFVNINPDANNTDLSIYGKYTSSFPSVKIAGDTISNLIQVGVSTNNRITINDGDLIIKGDGVGGGGELQVYEYFTDSDYQSSSSHVLQSINAGPALVVENSRSAVDLDGILIDFSDWDPDNNTATFLQCTDLTATRMRVYSDGDVWTVDAGTLTSDETLKENIVDATPKLDDVMKLKVRNYNWIEEFSPNQHDKKRIGFIAQEFEEVFPGLVSEHDISPDKENPNFKKGIKEAKLIPILTKALQEAVERIETLETELAALKSALGE